MWEIPLFELGLCCLDILWQHRLEALSHAQITQYNIIYCEIQIKVVTLYAYLLTAAMTHLNVFFKAVLQPTL